MLIGISLLRHWLARVLAYFGAALLTLLVFCVTWQVLSRYVLTRPSTLTDELARFLLIWLVLIGAAICTAARSHLAIDLLRNALGRTGRRCQEVYVELVVAGFAVGVMILGGLRMVATSAGMSEVSPALQLPMSYVYAILPLSGGLIFVFCVLNVLETALGQRTQRQEGKA